MKSRDIAQQIIYKIIDPLVRGMIKIGITPNFITASGLVLNILACCILIFGATHGDRGNFSYVGWGGFIILFAGLFDMMDGQVARIGKMSSRYGALFDSVLDRYSELIVLFGICYYLILQGYFFSSLFAFIALIGSMMVSYVRARAEGLGIECKGGFMQRPERVVSIGLGAMLCGIFYHFMGDYKVYIGAFKFPVFEPVLIFVIPLVIVAVFANITAVGRLMHCKRVLQEMDKKDHEK
ncbi:CDP-alcohol phosphatidyltransferase family protein [Dysgonomonas sp. 511]|uniref:CDP-alcohol phosphatidyltransferase family protein n=1 Tax=Dysgonomonas sp. 511 TaxID=2302930 RepID=UPI0013D00FBD|nr:CDP-alcohol phosphatidyltransferase family protein [Dysgonomonas sp. 511]NDV78562.1 CDP-alcohol phosphatidyltransferase family protein [Dysgonomonas sp. 511]